jgi:multisubunit Na+/H+ antiporter MnhG subunit
VDVSGADIAAAILLGIVVLAAAVSAVGILLSRDAYERLQYLSIVSTVGVCALAAAVVVKEALDQAGIKAILIAAVVVALNAALSHTTARAARTRQFGNLEVRPEEKQNRPPEERA